MYWIKHIVFVKPFYDMSVNAASPYDRCQEYDSIFCYVQLTMTDAICNHTGVPAQTARQNEESM